MGWMESNMTNKIYLNKNNNIKSKPELSLDPYDEALINEDIIKLEELD
jgi:hypothetical protein